MQIKTETKKAKKNRKLGRQRKQTTNNLKRTYLWQRIPVDVPSANIISIPAHFSTKQGDGHKNIRSHFCRGGTRLQEICLKENEIMKGRMKMTSKDEN